MVEQGLQDLKKAKHLQVWSERIAACRNSRQSVEEWCKENGVNRSSYYRWQRKVYELARKRAEPEFVEVSTRRSAEYHGRTATLRINGQEADIYPGIDEETLETICRVLRQC